MNAWFHLQPRRSTAVAVVLATLSVGASYLAGAAGTIGFFVLRDLVQVIIIGLVAPFVVASAAEWREAGLRFDRPTRYLAVSTLLGGLLVVQFATEANTVTRPIDANLLSGAAYVMVTNVFEVLFFACFLRERFERAFGIVFAILAASAAYSLHHAGFQPEYEKLFLVGVFFLSLQRTVRHWLVLFPLWWVGGLGDVLFRSAETRGVDWLSAAAGWRALLIAAVIASLLWWRREGLFIGRPSREPSAAS